jgi:hypothetical protein
MPMRWVAGFVILAAFASGRAAAQPNEWALQNEPATASTTPAVSIADAVCWTLFPDRAIAQQFAERTGLEMRIKAWWCKRRYPGYWLNITPTPLSEERLNSAIKP